jgi:hypothetical protein
MNMSMPTKTDMIHDEYYILAAYKRALQRGLSPEEARKALADDPIAQEKFFSGLISKLISEVWEEEHAAKADQP